MRVKLPRAQRLPSRAGPPVSLLNTLSKNTQRLEKVVADACRRSNAPAPRDTLPSGSGRHEHADVRTNQGPRRVTCVRCRAGLGPVPLAEKSGLSLCSLCSHFAIHASLRSASSAATAERARSRRNSATPARTGARLAASWRPLAATVQFHRRRITSPGYALTLRTSTPADPGRQWPAERLPDDGQPGTRIYPVRVDRQ